MNFQLSKHAAERCKKRNVTIEQIADTFDDPDETFPNPTDRGIIYVKTLFIRGIFRTIRLAIDDETEPNVVKTVMIADEE